VQWQHGWGPETAGFAVVGGVEDRRRRELRQVAFGGPTPKQRAKCALNRRCAVRLVSREAPPYSITMPRRDPRIDAYIQRAPEYARPILTKLRKVLLSADRGLEEDVKWGAPTLVRDGLVCSFMGFKRHTAVWFHKGALLADPTGLLIPGKTVAMRAAHFTSADQVPSRALAALVKQAVKLNASGVKAPKKSPASIVVPAELRRALARRPRAKAAFGALPPSHRREHADWVAAAKLPATRERRAAKVMERLMAAK